MTRVSEAFALPFPVAPATHNVAAGAEVPVYLQNYANILTAVVIFPFVPDPAHDPLSRPRVKRAAALHLLFSSSNQRTSRQA